MLWHEEEWATYICKHCEEEFDAKTPCYECPVCGENQFVITNRWIRG